MNTSIISCHTVCSDRIGTTSECALSKEDCKEDTKDQYQEKNVWNLSDFSTNGTETICVCDCDTSAGSKCYLSDTTEDDLCCQCYDHWRKLLETGKDKSVNRTAEGTNNQCCKYYYNEWSVCVADHAA